jgi:hypothetical protein
MIPASRAHVFSKTRTSIKRSHTPENLQPRERKKSGIGIGIGAARNWARPLSCALKERYEETHLVYTLRTR